MQAWSPYASTFFAFNSVAWTLSVEMFFYLLFPLLIINFSKTWHWKLAISIVMVFIALALIKVTDAKYSPGADEISYASWLYIWPPARLMEFVIGMIAGLSYLHLGKYLDRKEGLANAYGVLAIAIILFSAVQVPVFGYMLEDWGVISKAGRSWFVNSGAAPFFALGIFLIAGEKGAIQKILSCRPLVWLGEISFSVYLTHQVIISCIILNPKWTEGISSEVQMGLYWVFTLFISYCVWQLVEKPSQRFMRSLIRRTPSGIAGENAI